MWIGGTRLERECCREFVLTRNTLTPALSHRMGEGEEQRFSKIPVSFSVKHRTMNIELRTPNETEDRRYLIRTVVARLALASVRREQILRAASSARILNRCLQTPSRSGSKFDVRSSWFGVFPRSAFSATLLSALLVFQQLNAFPKASSPILRRWAVIQTIR